MFSIEGFEWDKNKAEINEKKHKVTFNEAVTVFYDEYALLLPDFEHSVYEERFLLLGLSERSNVLLVVHCERDNNIRLISARKATPKEIEQYRSQR